MKYIVIQDTSTDHMFAEYTDVNGNFFMISPASANVSVKGGAILTEDISGYTKLPSIVAQASSQLQKAKNNAIKQLERQLEIELSSGLTVPRQGTTSLVLPAGADNLIAFTQGLALLSAAIAAAPDATVVLNSSISQLFGRGVVDIQGNVIDMTVAQYQTLILTFGHLVGTKQGELLTKVGQVSSATTIEDIKAIVKANK